MKTQLYLVSVLFISSSVMAEQAVFEDNIPHFYLGAKAGYSYINNSCYGHYSECDNDNVGYGIFTGYQFKDWLGVELDATDYRDYTALYDARIVEADVIGYGLSLKASRSFGDDVQGYVRLGGAYLDLNRSAPFELDDNSGFSALGAVGFEYQLSLRWALRAEYQYLSDISGNDGHFTSLGLSYRFGQTKAKSIPDVIVEPEPVIEEEFVLEEAIQEENAEVIFTSTPLLFAIDSSILNNEAENELLRVAEFAKQHSDVTIWLEGYTDTTGTTKYNQLLSQRRAYSAGAYLNKLGVKNIYMKGKGEVEELAPSTDDFASRKVVVSITRNNELLDNW